MTGRARRGETGGDTAAVMMDNAVGALWITVVGYKKARVTTKDLKKSGRLESKLREETL